MKSRALGHVSNLSSGLAARGATFAAPSLVALLALAGVTAPPALSVGDARRSLEYARARAEEFERERARAAQRGATLSWEKLEQTVAALRSRIPQSLDPVVTQSALRLAAQRSGMELDSLVLGAQRDPLLPTTSDRLVVTLVELVGAGPIAAPVRVQRELAALGLPCCVLEANLDLPPDDSSRAQLRLQLGLLHFAPVLPQAESTDAAPDGEFP